MRKLLLAASMLTCGNALVQAAPSVHAPVITIGEATPTTASCRIDLRAEGRIAFATSRNADDLCRRVETALDADVCHVRRLGDRRFEARIDFDARHDGDRFLDIIHAVSDFLDAKGVLELLNRLDMTQIRLDRASRC